MKLIKKTFSQGLAVLSTCGLKIEKAQIEVWWELVKDLDDDYFVNSVLEVCKEHKTFWATDNVPALIRGKVVRLKQNERFKQMVEAHEQRHVEERKARGAISQRAS